MSIPSSKFIERMIEFEEQYLEQLMTHSTNNFHFYPVVRNLIFLFYIKRMEHQQQHVFLPRRSLPHNKIKTMAMRFCNIAMKLYYKVFANPQRKICGRDIIIFSLPTSRRFLVDGKSFHRIYDNILPYLPHNSLVVEMTIDQLLTPKYTASSQLAFLPAIERSILKKTPLVYNTEDKIASFVQLLASLIHQEFSFSVEQNVLRQIILNEVKKYDFFRKLFRRHKPRMIFVDEACYGTSRTSIVKAAKDNDIPIIEYQHGVVNRHHIAYFYSNIHATSSYDTYLPDYFFTFSDYWNQQLKNLPVKKVAIGYPQYAQINEFKAQPRVTKSTNILFILGPEKELLLHAIELGRQVTSPYCVHVKFHPLFPMPPQYKNQMQHPRIRVHEKANVYQLLQNSDFLVGLSSTVLFEGSIFQLPTFVLRSPLSDAYIPPELAERFSSTSELYEKITTFSKKISETQTNKYFSPDTQMNLQRFIKARP